MNFPAIYLASGSPRRRELLTQIEVDFSALSVDVDETRLEGETPVNYVKRVAIAKAESGLESLTEQEQRPVLGADTSVVLNNEIMGKPIDEADARTMLHRLSGASHQVLTAVAIVTAEQTLCELNVSTVTFAKLSNSDIEWYLATKEGVDKAGSYAVQGLAALFIKQIKGSYSGVMGLPLRETGLLLNQIAGAGYE